MYTKLLGMLKPHSPDVDRCHFLVEKLVDFIEEGRELAVEEPATRAIGKALTTATRKAG